MKKMKEVLSLMSLIVLCLTICTSCIGNIFKEDDDDPYISPEWSDFEKLDKNMFYKVQIADWTGFEEVAYHDNKYIAVKTDMQNMSYIYSIGDKNIDDRNNIYIGLNFDGSLLAFGKLDNLMVSCYDSSGNLAFFSLNDNRDRMTFKSTNRKHQYSDTVNMGGQTDAWTYIRNGLGNIPGLDVIIKSYDFGKEWVSDSSFLEILDTFATTNEFTHSDLRLPVNISYQDWKDDCMYLYDFLCNGADIEISDVTYQDNNVMNVKVRCSVLSYFPQFDVNLEESHFPNGVIDNYIKIDCEYISQNGKREVYAVSEEIPISNNEGASNTIVEVPVSVPNGTLIYLKPHLCPRIKFADDVYFRLFDKTHKYGYDFQYLCADGFISWKQVDAIGSTRYDANRPENNYERNITFKIEATGTLPILDAAAANLQDWGIAVFNNSDNDIPSQKFSLAETNGIIQIDNTEVNRIIELKLDSEYLTIDEEKYTANLEGWSICPYIDVKFAGNDDQSCYGKREPLNLTYDKKPSIIYNYAEYYSSYTRTQPPFSPHLINDEEKIYGDAESEFYTTFLITGGFFIKKRNWIRNGTGWTKYCTAWFEFWNDLDQDEFTDGDNQGPRSFCWNMSNFECLSTLDHHIEFETFCGDKGLSNVLSFVPVAHKDDQGKTYYFGYSPQIPYIP